MRNINFTDLSENFDSVCNTVNGEKEAVTLTLKSNRKVYIMPEEDYDSIQHFIIPAVSSFPLKFIPKIQNRQNPHSADFFIYHLLNLKLDLCTCF